MKNHLTDEELQYFLENTSGLVNDLVTHLKECSSCREKLDEYRNLFAVLSIDDRPAWLKMTDVKIMTSLPNPACSWKRIIGSAPFLAIIGFFTSLAGVLIFIGWNPLDLLQNAFTGIHFREIFNWHSYLSSLGLNYRFLSWVGLTVTLILIADHWLQRHFTRIPFQSHR